MRIVISGASGMVGSALIPSLNNAGHETIRLVRNRSKSGSGEILWDPQAGTLDAERLEGFDAILHLAGENIASGRWTAQKKRRIRDSRVMSTKLLAEAITRLAEPPATWICASAVGYYGNRGDELLREDSPRGTGFLPDVCEEWEKATQEGEERGVRVVRLRIGIVLDPMQGALARMLLPFRIGVGGKIGNGKQYMSWIALEDLVSIILFAIGNKSLSGAVNAVSPHPVTNHEFTKILGRVLSRPTIFPLPAIAARLLLGEMADQLLLASTRVVSATLEGTEFRYRFPKLEAALRHMLGKT